MSDVPEFIADTNVRTMPEVDRTGSCGQQLQTETINAHIKSEVKVTPLQAQLRPRGVQRYRWHYSSKTSALEGGEWSAACRDRTLPPGKTWYPLSRRLGWPQRRSGRVENLAPTGIRSPDRSEPVVSRHTKSTAVF
jgi:hypothetical protein